MGIWADEQTTSKADAVPDDIDAYGYLQGVYQGRWPYEPHRVRAARECLPFERPKLAVTAIIDPTEDFAARLDRCIERSRQPRTIEAETIETTVASECEGHSDQGQPSRPFGPLPDRRFRR